MTIEDGGSSTYKFTFSLTKANGDGSTPTTTPLVFSGATRSEVFDAVSGDKIYNYTFTAATLDSGTIQTPTGAGALTGVADAAAFKSKVTVNVSCNAATALVFVNGAIAANASGVAEVPLLVNLALNA